MRYGGYASFAEWKRTEPEKYWAWVNAEYERKKNNEDDEFKIKIDEEFVEKIRKIKIPEVVNPFYALVGRQIRGKETLWDKRCEEISEKGISHPLHEVFDRFMDGENNKKDLNKIKRINEGKHYNIWYVRFWNWIKKKMKFWRKNKDD